MVFDGIHGDERNADIVDMLRDRHAFAVPLKPFDRVEGELLLEQFTFVPGLPDWAHVQADLQDFLIRMRARVAGGGEGVTRVLLEHDPGLSAGTAKVDVSPAMLKLIASDLRGIWRAVAWVAHEMAWRHAPRLAMGTHSLAARYQRRITTSMLARGLESFTDSFAYDDNYLCSMAYFGYDALFVYFELQAIVDSALVPELNDPRAAAEIDGLQALLERAARYGISVFLLPAGPRLSAEHPVFQAHPCMRGATVMSDPKHALCPSSAKTRAFYAEQMTRLFSLRPAPGGIIFIIGGEGFLHCYTRPNPRTEKITNCPVCAGRGAPAVLAPMLNDLTQAIRSAAPEARPVFWPYGSRIWQDKDAQAYQWDLDLRLIEKLDPRASWLLQSEQDSFVEVAGVGTVHVYDYSIQHLGLSPRFQLEGDAVRRRGMELVVKTETTQTIELFSLPYIPVMQRWAKRHQTLRSTHAELCMDTWRLSGFWQAPSSVLAFWYSFSDTGDEEENLSRVARLIYGPSSAQKVLAAWESFSNAWETSYARYGTYWDGPLFLGPAHPFDIGTAHLSRSVYSDAFYHYSPGLREHGPDCMPSNPWRKRPKFHLMPGRWAPARIRDYSLASRHWQLGMQALREALELTPPDLCTRAQMDCDMAEMVGMFLRSDVDFNQFTRLRDSLNHTFPADPEYKEMLRQIEALLADNLEMSDKALTLVRRTAFLGWGYTFGMRFNAAMIEEKIRHGKNLLKKVRTCIKSGEALLV